MIFHCVGANMQLLGNFLIAISFDEKHEHFIFAVCNLKYIGNGNKFLKLQLERALRRFMKQVDIVNLF